MAGPDRIVAQLQIDIWQSGNLSVAGDINDERWAIAALQAAIDAVRSHHKKSAGAIIVPGHDTGLG